MTLQTLEFPLQKLSEDWYEQGIEGSFGIMFSHDVTAAMLVSQNKEMAAMLVSQTKPLGMEHLFLCKYFLLFQ